MADIHTQLWKDFQGFMFKQQITLVRALSDSDMATFMKKLLEKDFMLAKKMFLQFSYEAKKKVLGQVSKTTIRDLLCQSLPSVVKFKLLKEGVTVTLNNKELLSFVRAVLKKIPQRKPSIIRLIRTRVNAYANTKEGWKGQDLVADTQAKDESWFLNFFTDLDPKQKLHLFKSLSFLQYKKIMTSFQLETADAFDAVAASINEGNLGYCFSGYFDKNDQHHQVSSFNNDEIILWYINWLARPEKLKYLADLVRASAQLRDSFWSEVCGEVIAKMDDLQVRKLLRNCKGANSLVDSRRLFYVLKGNLNDNFELLQSEVSDGKVININVIDPLNKVRLLIAN